MSSAPELYKVSLRALRPIPKTRGPTLVTPGPPGPDPHAHPWAALGPVLAPLGVTNSTGAGQSPQDQSLPNVDFPDVFS